MGKTVNISSAFAAAWGALTPSAKAFIRAAISPNTARTYAAQWRAWTGYAASVRASLIPADPHVVANWLALRAQGDNHARGEEPQDKARDDPPESSASQSPPLRRKGSKERGVVSGLAFVYPREAVNRGGDKGGRQPGRQPAGGKRASPSTLRSALSAIKFAHLAAGLSFDTAHPAIRLVLQGIVRSHPKAPRQASPLRREIVQSVIAELEDDVAGRRDAALLALGYCFGRRRSELTQLDYERIGAGSGALRITKTVIELRIIRSKNNARIEEEIYVVPVQPNKLAVAAIARWIEAAELESGQPLLRRVFKSGRVGPRRLDPQSVALIIKRRLTEYHERHGLGATAARRAVAHFSGHSLRVGLAVASAEAGASVLAIQNALGHKTPVMAARYARAAERAKTSPHLLPGVALGSDRPSVRRNRKERER